MRSNCLPDEIFVFGSNLAGRHGKGAARYAHEHRGALYGIGEGRAGASYAIPTKDGRLLTLPLDAIEASAQKFLAYARCNPDLKFFVSAVGCGLAGYKSEDIAPFFKGAPANCRLPDEWLPFTIK